MFGGEVAWNWGIGLVAFAFGVVAGIIVTYLFLVETKRAKKLQEELERVQGEFDDHRGRVNAHFQKTSDLFHGMTKQYRAVYDHLAEGAQSLCSEELQTPQLEIPETRLVGTHGPETAAADETAATAESEPPAAESDAAEANAEAETETEMESEVAPPVRPRSLH